MDDVALIAANGLHRRMTAAELQHLLGERVFRSFYADGLLTNHDAEDTDNLTRIGETEAGEVKINSRAAAGRPVDLRPPGDHRPQWRRIRRSPPVSARPPPSPNCPGSPAC